ncbi:DeoR/GlpR family DNA-binding transcription regulator [uncultured Ruminococcus sp.]|uniref:DeoR/GlpR family DNA-binding transcription regulator n=1 Tax=uncultured Ruminococcus sp. TaxID=165186 RepID=UPI0029304526|nr:DeoR/GlpR family DNA-binding transcription regulator [uncultured Ruminococcus sp.]
MLTEERYQLILQLLNDRNAVTVAELSGLMHISESTIRRDLNALAEMGKLRKVFGGATALEQSSGVYETGVANRALTMSEEKTAIAAYAATLIHDDDFVYIDAGTTTARLIDFIENRRATYVTNGILHGQKLIAKGLNTYMIGGKIKPLTEAVVGAEGIRSLEGLNFTKAFMGTNGIDVKAGFTTPDIDEARVKHAAVKNSYMTFVVADHTKFYQVCAATFAPLKIGCIITDACPDSRYSNITIVKEVKK